MQFPYLIVIEHKHRTTKLDLFNAIRDARLYTASGRKPHSMPTSHVHKIKSLGKPQAATTTVRALKSRV